METYKIVYIGNTPFGSCKRECYVNMNPKQVEALRRIWRLISKITNGERQGTGGMQFILIEPTTANNSTTTLKEHLEVVVSSVELLGNSELMREMREILADT